MFGEHTDLFYSRDLSCDSISSHLEAMLTPKCAKHNPAEHCSPDDCMNGAQVLMGAVLRYDVLRAQRSIK